MTRKVFSAVFVAAALSAGCFSVSRTSGPTGTGQSLSGIWTSVQSGSLQDNCKNFTWAVTEYSGNSASGTFSATCFDVVQIAGTAHATFTSGSSLNWNLSANASGPGVPTICSVSLTGTATIETTQIRIPYSGTSCLGPITGTEIIKKG
jgi:hypothetical protein